jgi:4-hydroxybenzoate polyprenyltransferase
VKSIVYFIKVLRPLNLLIIAGTMYAMRWLVIYPIISNQSVEMELQMPEWLFFISTLIIVFLAASGNIINDYFDIKVDRINRPEKVLVGKYVKRRVAMAGHHAFNIIAVLLTGLITWQTKQWILLIVPVFMAGSLWYYSLMFKKQVLIGNLVVALMVAIVPLWSGIFEIQLLADEYGGYIQNAGEFFSKVWMWLLGYAGFAFVLTLIREAQKDLEDLKGDVAGKFRTLPIVYGSTVAKTYIGFLMVINLVIIITIGYRLSTFMESTTLYWTEFLLLIILPLIGSWYFTSKGSGQKDYGLASQLTKIAMGGGILFAFMIKELFAG